ncbi:hypothetical protein [Arthrobacter sp. ERGS1:01]|uniref:hypothetical protein n=1 Tax=Arthrobacter sp. ERGS1:01 TaxID=1704044 RepID=UPI000B10F173|nr:hypothetical protein [Arthrobacter sp. ERGS1:01]
MKHRILLACFAATSLVLGSLGSLASSANAETPIPPSTIQATSTAVYFPFDHRVSLADAVSVAIGTKMKNIVSYKFETQTQVGEYGTGGGQTPTDFLAKFKENYGTVPSFIGISVMSPLDATTKRPTLTSRTLATGKPVAPLNAMSAAAVAKYSPDATQSEIMVPQAKVSGVAPMAAASAEWRPNNVEVQVQRFGARTWLIQRASWSAGASPANVQDGAGLEFEVNLYNTATSDARPACNGNYKDHFIAKNYGWNWIAISNPAQRLNAVQPYADYNDLSDPCNRNSMAIGIRYPRGIPQGNNSIYSITLIIDAPNGDMPSSKVGGLVQQVSDSACFAFFWMALTDCMGLTSLPTSQPLARMTLNETKNWVAAPNLCWDSPNFGTTPATLQVPSRPGGCY